MRKLQQEEAVLVVDDSIAHQPHSAINGLVCSHYDHSSGQQVKGINFVTLLYCVKDIRIPVGWSVVVKFLQSELKTRQQVWRAMVSKNELFRQMLHKPIRMLFLSSMYLGDS